MIDLKQIKYIETRLKQRQRQAEELRQSALLLGSLNLKPDKVQTSLSNSPLEEITIELLDVEERIKVLALRLERTRAKVINKIQKLDNEKYMNALFKRFFEYKSHKTIAAEMDLSPGYVDHLITKAINAYRKIN